MDEARSWEDLTRWCDVPGSLGQAAFRERFTEEALASITPRWPFTYQVVRDEWIEEPGKLPKRIIHEVVPR